MAAIAICSTFDAVSFATILIPCIFEETCSIAAACCALYSATFDTIETKFSVPEIISLSELHASFALAFPSLTVLVPTFIESTAA